MVDPPDFSQSEARAEVLFKAGKRMEEKGETAAEAGFPTEYLRAYGAIARRYDDDRRMGLIRYPYEAAPGVGPYSGGFFAHPDWALTRRLSQQPSMRAIAEHESPYMNACGYWAAFGEAAISLRGDELKKEENAGARAAEEYDVWAIVARRYNLRVIGLRTEFYRLAADDPTHARMVMPALEKRVLVPAADNMDAALARLDTHMATQLMKAAASASAAKKYGGASGAGQ